MSSEELEGEGYVFFTTGKGKVKKTHLKDYANIRSSGIIAINLSREDYLAYVGLTNGKRDVLLVTSMGQSIRFEEKDVRTMGRTASGVTGIRLAKKDDIVVGAIVVPEDDSKGYLMVAAKKGYGKKTVLNEYKAQKRGGSGILTYKVTDKTGSLVSARLLREGVEADLIVATTSGKVIRLDSNEVPSLGRSTLGVKLINLSGRDSISSVAVLDFEEDEE
jgi:DNA gyrase subunit A